MGKPCDRNQSSFLAILASSDRLVKKLFVIYTTNWFSIWDRKYFRAVSRNRSPNQPIKIFRKYFSYRNFIEGARSLQLHTPCEAHMPATPGFMLHVLSVPPYPISSASVWIDACAGCGIFADHPCSSRKVASKTWDLRWIGEAIDIVPWRPLVLKMSHPNTAILCRSENKAWKRWERYMFHKMWQVSSRWSRVFRELPPAVASLPYPEPFPPF